MTQDSKLHKKILKICWQGKKKQALRSLGKAIPFYTRDFKSHHRYEVFCSKETEPWQDDLPLLIERDAGTYKVTFEMAFANNATWNCICRCYTVASHAFTILQALTLALLLLGMPQTLLCFLVSVY